MSAAQSLQGKDSLCALQQAANFLPNDAEVLNNLGDMLAKHNLQYEAEPCFRRAIALKPQYLDALHNLGVTLVHLNKVEEANACFLRVLAIDPGCIEARYFLTQSKKVAADDANFIELVKIEQRLSNQLPQLPDADRLFLHYALAKGYHDSGDSTPAFQHYQAGAQLKRKSFQYDAKVESHNVDELIRIFDEARLARLSGCGNPDPSPIFIVGMPRSGTTLTEQILASHPDVHGAGELTDLFSITQRNLAGVVYPGSLRLLESTTMGQWSSEYLAAIRLHHSGAKRITDKLPANFMAVGLIHLMLPNAKIIHVNRNPMDTCLSCYTNLFHQNNVPWSYDQIELGQYYRDYHRLMAHWRRVLPASAFLDVHYEDIVQDRETQTRRMLEYCGLAWSDSCALPHEHVRPVKTASFLQVRRPVYASSVERWRRYEQHLSPLLATLGDVLV
ncbi:MAG: sulfotransferase [Gallionella sp.]|nr:sulfotransferase [Gallionella sp.]